LKYKITDWSPDWGFLSEPSRYKVHTQAGDDGYLHVWYDVSNAKTHITLRVPSSTESIPEHQIEIPQDLNRRISKSIPAFKIRHVGQIIACICMLAFLVFIVLAYLYGGIKYVIDNPRKVITTIVLLAIGVSIFVVCLKLKNVFRKRRMLRFLHQFDALIGESTSSSMPTIAGIQLGETFADTEARLNALHLDRKVHPELKNVCVLNITPEYLHNPIPAAVQVWTHQNRVFEIRVFLREFGDEQFQILKEHLSNAHGNPEDDDPTDILGFGPRERKFRGDADAGPVTIHLFHRDPERELTENPFIDRGSAYLYVSYIHDGIWEELHGYPPRISSLDDDQVEADDTEE